MTKREKKTLLTGKCPASPFDNLRAVSSVEGPRLVGGVPACRQAGRGIIRINFPFREAPALWAGSFTLNHLAFIWNVGI